MKFWDVVEHELRFSVEAEPEKYVLRQGEDAPRFAARLRHAMELAGFSRIAWKTPTFKRVAKRLGIPFTRKALVLASVPGAL